jgi:hypothetical protein
VIWAELEHSRVLWILHHPRYAGVFCFGRSSQRRRPDGKVRFQRLPREQWAAFLPDAHEGYITWAQYEDNVQRLRDNAMALGGDRRKSPPREGPALLQGLAICAVCGDRMTLRYHAARGRQVPDYVCQRRGIQRSEPICQAIPGAGVDQAIGRKRPANSVLKTASRATDAVGTEVTSADETTHESERQVGGRGAQASAGLERERADARCVRE